MTDEVAVNETKEEETKEEEWSIRYSAYDVMLHSIESVERAIDGECCLSCAHESLEMIRGCAKMIMRS
jgi:hypothetical protein